MPQSCFAIRKFAAPEHRELSQPWTWPGMAVALMASLHLCVLRPGKVDTQESTLKARPPFLASLWSLLRLCLEPGACRGGLQAAGQPAQGGAAAQFASNHFNRRIQSSVPVVSGKRLRHSRDRGQGSTRRSLVGSERSCAEISTSDPLRLSLKYLRNNLQHMLFSPDSSICPERPAR